MEDPAGGESLESLLGAALGTSAHARSLLSGTAWRTMCAALEQAERLVVGPGVPAELRADEHHRAQGYRYLARFLAAGLRSCLTHDDPDYPMLQRMIDYATPWGLDHPDCLYLSAPLRGDASYTLFGDRGTANVLDIQVNAGHFSAGRVDAIRTLASREVDASDRVELRIGPDVSPGAGLSVGPDARFLVVRQYFADWAHERPANLQIERDEAAWPIPPARPALVGRQLETLTHWIERTGAQWEGLSQRVLSMPPNSIVVHGAVDGDSQGALAGQVYGMGHFQCAPDEAVVVRFTPPVCTHWNVSLSNWFWECIEYGSRQSSLNQHQAVVHPDGGIHCVVAHRDPGVANWLDAGGTTRGTIALRLHRARSKPEVDLERVPLVRIASVLPPETPRVTPEERRDILTSRRRAVIRRNRT